MILDDQQWKEHIEMLKAAKAASQGTLSAVTCSVDRLKQYVTSAWVEAEAVCVDAQTTGPSAVMMIFKARDMLREVLHVLNSNPPNE